MLPDFYIVYLLTRYILSITYVHIYLHLESNFRISQIVGNTDHFARILFRPLFRKWCPFQIVWNVFSIGLLYLGVIWIGLYTKYLTERAQRKAFLETRRSLEMRFKTQKGKDISRRLKDTSHRNYPSTYLAVAIS